MEVERPYVCNDRQELSLSGAATIELLQSTFAKKAFFRFKAQGFSMFPFVLDQDIIILSPLWRSGMVLGKPVACVCPKHKGMLVHRIVAKKGDRYLIKGDNCRQPDGLIEEKDILGCVISIERNSKNVFFGLGPERTVIAFLSRSGLLFMASRFFQRLTPKPLKRFIKCRILT